MSGTKPGGRDYYDFGQPFTMPPGYWEALSSLIVPTPTPAPPQADQATAPESPAGLPKTAVERLGPLPRGYFSPDQPRAPAGSPDGGQWTGDGGGADGGSKPAPATSREAGKALRQRIEVLPKRDWQDFDAPSDEQDQALYDHYQPLIGESARDAMYAFGDYQGPHSVEINAFMRTGATSGLPERSLEGMKKDIAVMMATMNSPEARLPMDAIVYRGFPADRLPQDFTELKDTIVSDKGFISTSLSLDTAYAFSALAASKDETLVVAALHLPKGTPAVYLGNPTYDPIVDPEASLGEQELLLPPGRFRITGIVRTTPPIESRTTVVLEMEPVKD